jgi:hypothetical protein
MFSVSLDFNSARERDANQASSGRYHLQRTTDARGIAMSDNKSATIKVHCELCETNAMGLVGFRHRRCPGQTNQPPRAKRAERLPHEKRGKWVEGWKEKPEEELTNR